LTHVVVMPTETTVKWHRKFL